jgi:transcriptional regulator with XRE-family HTH domain
VSQGKVSAAVSARIQAARKNQGVTAQALADGITAQGFEISRVVIAKIEAGIRETVPVDVVVHAAHVLHVPVLSFLTDGAWCAVCGDAPPAGFTCNTCGAAA